MESWERAYREGRRDALAEAVVVLQRGLWWHLRDGLARGLHWLAMRIEPKT